MRHLLEDFWYGNISPQTDSIENNLEIKKLLELMGQNRDKLCKTISNEEQLTLEKYDDCLNEMNGIIEREAFIYGFKLGGNIMLEIMRELNNEWPIIRFEDDGSYIFKEELMKHFILGFITTFAMLVATDKLVMSKKEKE